MIRKNEAITLVALVITIIVMLILVGTTVTVSLNGGLFKSAKQATLDTRASVVMEKVTEWKADKEMFGSEMQTLDDLLNDLETQELITAEERNLIETEGKVTIGSKTIIFED